MNHIELLERAGTAAVAAPDCETALRALLTPLAERLGDRTGGPDLPEGLAQFFVAGAFLVTPDEGWHMLVANINFPPDQSRLMIPIEGGHPGAVRRSGNPLHLPDTENVAGDFKQYLKTARMGSTIYVPMIWKDRFLGQIVMAGRAANSLSETDFRTMRAAAGLAAAVWVAQGGPDWLETEYPPANAFRVGIEGMGVVAKLTPGA